MIFCGDSLEVLRTLPDESVQCCVTSPPYWGLRDYGVEGQIGLEKNKVKSLIVHKKENMPGREGVRDYSRRGWGSDYTSELRNSRTVWEIPTQPTKEKHFATFPDELVRRCIVASTKPGDLVIDPFLGSGTTYKVALELGCKAIGIELNPDYIKIAEHKISSIHPLFQ